MTIIKGIPDEECFYITGLLYPQPHLRLSAIAVRVPCHVSALKEYLLML